MNDFKSCLNEDSLSLLFFFSCSLGSGGGVGGHAEFVRGDDAVVESLIELRDDVTPAVGTTSVMAT